MQDIGFLAVFSLRKHAFQVFFVMCSKLVMQILQNHHSEAVFSWDNIIEENTARLTATFHSHNILIYFQKGKIEVLAKPL